ncbi:MAG: hypothetical protein V2J02_01565 [Pseudomonadales bacterium]|jgi:hypothetical protein|nr:hypothetical protein [Pseudomonadales bacterium]
MLEYRIWPEFGAMAVRVVGDASAEEFWALHHRIVDDARFRPDLNMLVDLEAVGTLELTAEDVRQFAAADPFSSASRRVFVAAPGGEVGYGLARVYAASTEHGGENVRVVFDHLEEALSWLGLPEELALAVRGEDD